MEKVSKSCKIRFHVGILLLILLLLPIGAALTGIIGSFSPITILFAIYVVCALINKRKIIRTINTTGGFFLAYFLYSIFSLSWGGIYERYIVVSLILNMLVFILASTDIYNQRELNSIKMAVGLSIVVALVASIFSLLNSDSNRLEVTIFSSIDPNEFSSSLCFCCAYLLSIIFSTKKRLLTILGIACCFVLIFLTGSRGGILNICVIFFVWFLFYGGKYRFKILLVAFVFAVIIFSVMFRDLSSYMLNRFNIFASLSSDGGAGRFNIWMAALNKFNESNLAYKFFGYGYGMFVPSVNYIAVGHTNAYMSHNMWIDCLITGGIIGVLLLFCAFLSVLYYAWKNKNCWGFLAVISFLVSGLSIDAQFYKTFSIVLVIAFIFKNGEVKNEVKRNCTNIQCRAISKKLS